MKSFLTVLILVFAISLLMASPVMAEKLENLSSGYCLDTDGRAVNGGVVRMWNCEIHPNQTWTEERVDRRYWRLRNDSSKFCLDTDGSKMNGAQVRMWECANHPNQLWDIERDYVLGADGRHREYHYRLKNIASGFCLDTDGRAANGGIVRMWNCETHPNQSWLIASAELPYGPDTCIQGYVWREAFPGDHVCVTPNTRAQAAYDNSQAGARREPGGGAYGPDTCRQGYVWREAGPQDHVCVEPSTRAQAWDDNAHAGERFARNNRNCAHCNDGSCQCGYGTPAELCANHNGYDPNLGCTQQE